MMLAVVVKRIELGAEQLSNVKLPSQSGERESSAKSALKSRVSAAFFLPKSIMCERGNLTISYRAFRLARFWQQLRAHEQEQADSARCAQDGEVGSSERKSFGWVY